MAKKPAIFALSSDGKLFVRLHAVMSTLCALVDGLPLAFFGKGKTAYLEVDRAIAWCKEEMKYHNREKYETMIAVMEKAKTQCRGEPDD